MSRPEALFERQLLPALSRAVPELVLFKNEVGEGYYGRIGPMLATALRPWPEAARAATEVLVRNRVSYGLRVGSSDLVGVLGPTGQAVFLELKAQGRLSPEQAHFLEAMRNRGAIGAEVRSLEDAIRAVRGGA